MSGVLWEPIFKQHGAIWIHDNNPKRPHALLTSGLHSNGFVNCSLVTQDAALLQQIVAHEAGLAPIFTDTPAWVVGSAYGAVTFAYAIAVHLKAQAGFTEKDGDAMKLARFEIKPAEKVLVVEDTISTGGSTLKTIEGIQKAGVPAENILPYIVCLVNRSGSPTLNGRELRALITLDIQNWKPEECPLCKSGSQVVRPKANWAALTAKYE
ncbi:MAG TPA: orotate phosphoribosyltransferase [Planctomycetota bacterium]|nr:orotate phosphoribosyltransferase [Planctomycetota bacterium]